MKRYFYPLLLIFIVLKINAQSTLGYSVMYRFMDYPNWNNKPHDQIAGNELANFADQAGIGFEYTKQIKKTSLNSLAGSFGIDFSVPSFRLGEQGNAILQAGYRFYPFNQEDCDCPSFYQTGSMFSRGFNITPRAGVNTLWFVDDGFQFLLIGGVVFAIDIPISKTTSISPFAGISVTSYANHPAIAPPNQKSNINSFNLGVKLLKHMSKKRY